MSDDLVTRLRDIAWVSPDASDATIADKVVHEAADEIECLRADRDLWKRKYEDTHKALRALGNYNE